MDPAKGILKIGPLSGWGFVRRCLLGAVAISVGSVSSTAFQMMALSAYFNLRYGFRYGLFFGALVSLTFCTIAQIAASCQAGQGRHPGRKPKAPSFLIFPRNYTWHGLCRGREHHTRQGGKHARSIAPDGCGGSLHHLHRH